MRAVRSVTTVAAIAMLVSGCSFGNVHRTTRYFVTGSNAGKTIQLKRGDLVTFNLPLRGDHDWIAVSSDPTVAKLVATEVTISSNGGKARFIDLTLVGTGHATLTACPTADGTCSPSVAGSLTVDVDVT
jgi:hypothetical protein